MRADAITQYFIALGVARNAWLKQCDFIIPCLGFQAGVARNAWLKHCDFIISCLGFQAGVARK